MALHQNGLAWLACDLLAILRAFDATMDGPALFLDLSGCESTEIIRQFVHAPTRVSGQKTCSPIALEMVCVGGCCKYLSEQ